MMTTLPSLIIAAPKKKAVLLTGPPISNATTPPRMPAINTALPWFIDWTQPARNCMKSAIGTPTTLSITTPTTRLERMGMTMIGMTGRTVRPVMPIIVIPILSSLVVGVVMLKVVGVPIADFMQFLAGWVQSMNHGNAVLMAGILGGVVAFDMGGPVNKTAFFFGAAMIKEGNVVIMGACAAAICTPPLGLGLATLINRKRWTQEQRESGIAAMGMGMIGITEGAIPFAAGD